MKRNHILKTELGKTDLMGLIEAAAALDLRVGWLDWQPETQPDPGDLGIQGLAEMASTPVLRAVTVQSRRVTSIKPMAGGAVFYDVLRSHFRGCSVVLVRSIGESEPEELLSAPELRTKDDKYAVDVLDENGSPKSFLLTAGELAIRLRRPRPFQD